MGSRDKVSPLFCPFTYSEAKTVKENEDSPSYAVPDEFANTPLFNRQCVVKPNVDKLVSSSSILALRNRSTLYGPVIKGKIDWGTKPSESDEHL